MVSNHFVSHGFSETPGEEPKNRLEQERLDFPLEQRQGVPADLQVAGEKKTGFKVDFLGFKMDFSWDVHGMLMGC